VGLSNKPSLEPFDISTNSGKVLQMIIDKSACEFFKINLVDYAPLDSSNKLRYPSKKEINDAKRLNKLLQNNLINEGPVLLYRGIKQNESKSN
jgi:hypothetical protein